MDDEEEFDRRRTELLDGFAAWARDVEPSVEPSMADVALDWKFGYGDGELTTWTVAELEEFALGWCPRKLTIPPDMVEPLLEATGAFFVFLAARGLLGPDGAGAEQLASWCRRNTKRFAQAMADRSNFGMAKSLFAGLGVEPPDDPDEIAAVAERIQGLSPEQVEALLAGSRETPEIGPVRMPSDRERVASAAAAPVLAQMRALHEYCAPPGRTLTQKGNPRVADARELVGLLATGDVLEETVRAVRSADDLPELTWLVRVALQARVVRRHKGRLVAVATWVKLGPVEALDRVVDAAVEVGLGGPVGYLGVFTEWLQSLREGWRFVLFNLLDAMVAEADLDVDEEVAHVVEFAQDAFPQMGWLTGDVGASHVYPQIEHLAALGVLTWDENGSMRLTPAGVGVATRLLEADGVVVTHPGDPAAASADDVVDLADRVGPEAWAEDATAWASARGPEAPGELGDALARPGREPMTVLAVLGGLEAVLAERAPDAVRRLVGGRWDGLAATWLADHGDTTLVDQEPGRALAGSLDVLGVLLDAEGPDAVVESITGDHPPADVIDLLDRLWRVEHQRVAEILEVLGRHHGDKTVAKHARTVLAKHRSRVGSARGSASPGD